MFFLLTAMVGDDAFHPLRIIKYCEAKPSPASKTATINLSVCLCSFIILLWYDEKSV